MKKVLSAFFYLIILLFSSLLIPKNTLAIVLRENFNDGNLNGWMVVNEPGRVTCSAPWHIENDELTIEIDQYSCTTHLVPTDELWNNLGNEYQIEYDMRIAGGTDHNVAFRFNVSPPNTNEWYGYHFIFPSSIVLERVPSGGIDHTSYNFERNKTYHIKILMQTGNIELSIDNIMVLDYHYNPQNDRFPTGKFAFRIGTGNDPYSKTYFDNLVIKSLDEFNSSISPIVLLPGLGGSWNTSAMLGADNSGIWKKTPFVKVYDNLKNTFISNAGYTEGTNYFEFYYDWRKPVDQLADKLKDYLENTVLAGKPTDTKVNLVGHSLGGMVSRAYIQKYGSDKINKLVTSGSPHQGALPAWTAWAGGEVGDPWSWQWLALQLYLNAHKFKYLSNVAAVRGLAPGLNNLTPTFNFAKNNQSQEINVAAMDSFNDYLNNLNGALSDGLKALITTISGDNQSQTMEWIDLTDRTAVDRLLGRWPDGRPQNYEYTSSGDLTVLKKSALISGSDQNTLTANHHELVETAGGIQAILDALELRGVSPSTAVMQPNRNPLLVLWLRSPATLKVTNPDGQPENPDYYYPDDKLWVIPGAQSGKYQLLVTGTDTGSYHLDIGQLTDSTQKWTTVNDDTSPGTKDDWQIYFDGQNPWDNPLNNLTTDQYLNLAKTKFNELKNYIDGQTLKLTTKIKLKLEIDKIIKLINRGKIQDALTAAVSLRKDQGADIKNQLTETAELLINAYLSSSPAVSQKLAKSQVDGANASFNNLKTKVAAKVSGENQTVGEVYNLAENYLSQAQTKLTAAIYPEAYITAAVSRLLSAEASGLVK